MDSRIAPNSVINSNHNDDCPTGPSNGEYFQCHRNFHVETLLWKVFDCHAGRFHRLWLSNDGQQSIPRTDAIRRQFQRKLEQQQQQQQFVFYGLRTECNIVKSVAETNSRCPQLAMVQFALLSNEMLSFTELNNGIGYSTKWLPSFDQYHFNGENSTKWRQKSKCHLSVVTLSTECALLG